MKDNIQIVLYFSKESFYNPVKVGAAVNNKFKEVGEPIILPNNIAPQEVSLPILIFNQNLNFQITSNFETISIILAEEYISKYKEILEEVYDLYKNDNEFFRIGYVCTNILEPDKIDEVKNKHFKQEEVISSRDFQLSWLNNIKIADRNINCWQRYVSDTEQENINGLISIFDFNTNPKENVELTKEYIIQFIDECNEYRNQNK